MQLFFAAFESVPDPRAENTRHDLVELLIVAFVAVLCGAQNCSEMAEFGCEKIKLLKRFLKLKHGIPSHDTFSTVLNVTGDLAAAALVARRSNAEASTVEDTPQRKDELQIAT